MRREFLIAALIGLLVVSVAAVGVLWLNRGSRMLLEGQIQTTRTQALDEISSALAVDFRLSNPSDLFFMVREVEVIVDVDGKLLSGALVADSDAKRFFGYYPALGQKFNETLRTREKIGARQTVDKMILARFEIPEAKLKSRKGMKIRIEEVDGMVTEIAEKR